MTEPLPIFFPSRDNRNCPSTTTACILAAITLKRQIAEFTLGGIGQAVSLNFMMKQARETLGHGGIVRALWVEDDVIMSPSDDTVNAIVQLIQKADENKWNIVAPYLLGNGQISYFHATPGDNSDPFTLDEIEKLQPYDVIPLAGLGFYYGNVNLDYIFHEGQPNKYSKFGGIDWNLWDEEKVELRHYPLSLMHQKQVVLSALYTEDGKFKGVKTDS